MFQRRQGLAILALCALPLVAAADDAPPWARPAPSAATAPAGETAGIPTDDPAEAFGELLAPLLGPEALRKLRGARPEERSKLLASEWDRLKPHQRAQVRFAMDHLTEAGRVATQRSTALLVLGPPQAIHSEPAREFAGEMAERIDALGVLAKRLGGEAAKPDAETLTLTGSHPAEVWVYPGETVIEVRMLLFVDADGNGVFRLVRDQVLPAGTTLSAVAGVEVPADLFPPASGGAPVDALPALTASGLTIKARADFFKASAGRTFARFTIVVDPKAVDFDLGLVPDAFAETASALVRVEAAGAAVWQGSVGLKASGATASTPWMTELSVPLLPGSYSVTVQVADSNKAGGKTSMDVTVPAFSGSLELSSVIATVAGRDGLPKAPAVDAADLLPFQVGNYIVRPSATGQFKRGDSVAFVVQVYGSQAATIEYDLWRDNVYQSSLSPEKVSSLPSTQIMMLDLTEAFRDGAYELRITVKNPANPAQVGRSVAPFRVRG